MEKSDKEKKVGQSEKADKLEEKKRKPTEAKSVEETEGVAESVLKGVGQIIPGFSNLVEGLENLPAFKEKLKEIDREVDRRLKDTPTEITKSKVPHVESGFSTRTLVQEEKPFFKRKEKKPPGRLSPQPREPVADVFDEKDHLRIIVELPGVAEKDVKTSLEEDTLTIKINSSGWKPEHKVALPYAPKSKLKQVYRNGFLEIEVTKD